MTTPLDLAAHPPLPRTMVRTTAAAAICLFHFNSGALATIGGVPIKLPVMLTVVWIVNWGPS